MADVGDLEPPAQMVFYTGAVVRNDVYLEHQLNQVYGQMATGLAWAAPPQGLTALVSAIRRMFDADAKFTPPDLLTGVKVLLDDVQAVHAERNRLVHDLWWNLPDLPADQFQRQIMRGQRPKGPSLRHLQEFKVCADELWTCAFRVGSLLFVLSDRDGPGFWKPSDVAQWMECVRGDVRLMPDGGFRVGPVD